MCKSSNEDLRSEPTRAQAIIFLFHRAPGLVVRYLKIGFYKMFDIEGKFFLLAPEMIIFFKSYPVL